jgi:AraC family transcriptional regulator
MPENKDLKRLVRERMAATGERYTEALARILVQTPLTPLPGWAMMGDRPLDYEFGLVPPDAAGADHRVARLRLRAEVGEARGFGTMAQQIAAAQFTGARIGFRGVIRTHAAGWAGLWMRVDGEHGVLAFDNMRNRAARGTRDWTQASVVLDVPEQAVSISFGLILVGEGAADLSDARLDQVDESVSVTNVKPGRPLPSTPKNLDFATHA